jgi:alginate O-acetyltransferase complex protein AlgI
MVEKWVPALQKLPGFFRHLYTLLVVAFGWVLFNATDLSQLGADLAGLLGLNGLPLISAETIYYLRSFALVLILGIIGSTPLVRDTANRLSASRRFGSVTTVVEMLVMLGILLICTGYLVDGAFSPFLYFRF